MSSQKMVSNSTELIFDLSLELRYLILDKIVYDLTVVLFIISGGFQCVLSENPYHIVR